MHFSFFFILLLPVFSSFYMYQNFFSSATVFFFFHSSATGFFFIVQLKVLISSFYTYRCCFFFILYLKVVFSFCNCRFFLRSTPTGDAVVDCCRMLRFAVTEPTSHHVPDRYRVTGSLTRDMLLEFNRQLMNNIYIEGFVTGNFYRRVVLLFLLQNICFFNLVLINPVVWLIPSMS